MFVLVLFDDGVRYVCPEKRVTSVQGVECIVKYSNGCRYPARILQRNSNRIVLNDLKEKLEEADSENKENVSDSSGRRCAVEAPPREADDEKGPKLLRNFNDVFGNENGLKINKGQNSFGNPIFAGEHLDVNEKENQRETATEEPKNKTSELFRSTKLSSHDLLTHYTSNVDNKQSTYTNLINTAEILARKADDETADKKVCLNKGITEEQNENENVFDDEPSSSVSPTGVHEATIQKVFDKKVDTIDVSSIAARNINCETKPRVVSIVSIPRSKKVTFAEPEKRTAEDDLGTTYTVIPVTVCSESGSTLINEEYIQSCTSCQNVDTTLSQNASIFEDTNTSVPSGIDLSFGGSNSSSAPPTFDALVTDSVLTRWLDEIIPHESSKSVSHTMHRPLNKAFVHTAQASQCNETNTSWCISSVTALQSSEITVQSNVLITQNERLLNVSEQPISSSTPNETALDTADVANSHIQEENVTHILGNVSNRTAAEVLHSNVVVEKTESRVRPFDESSYFSDDQRSNESDYVPSPVCSDENTENDSVDEKDVNECSIRKLKSNRRSNHDASLEVSLSINVPGKSTRDDAEMYVTTASGQKGLDRRSYCMYCQKMQTKFVRHLENKHKDVKEVKTFSDLPKKNPERLKIIDTIRKNCMFDFNTNNGINDGELMVVRRPNKNAPRDATNFKICQNCKGFFSKDNIRHHAKRCFGFNGKKHRTLSVLGRRILGRIHEEASDILRKDVFPILREDDIVRLIRYDRLVILYGNKLCAKYGSLRHQHDMIRSHLRHLGRFLHAIKSINDQITDFASVYHPKFYDDAVLAIYKISGFDPKTKTYEAPATAYAIGSLLKKVANFYIFDCIKREDVTQKIRTENFLKLLNVDIEVSVNKNVTESQTLQKRRKKVELPSHKDIQTLHNYLRNERTSAFNALQKGFDASAWQKLAETTLISVQLFNRRRPGEIERTSIEDFKTYQGINKEELKTLSKESQAIAKNYVRFTIRGKKGRTVPVLLTMELINCIEKILQYRKEAKVGTANEYVFGIQHSKTAKPYMRACLLMRKFASASGVTFPNRLTGTTLRKHIATNCINLNLSENEIADVANFMGHAEKIHREHYRQPIVSREILRMSKVLELAQGGDDDDGDDDEEESTSETEDATKTICEKEAAKNNQEIEKRAKIAKVGKKRSRLEMVHENVDDSESDTLMTPTKVPCEKPKRRSTSPYGPVGSKKRWSTEDKETVQRIFGSYFKSRTLPSLSVITKSCSNYPSLRARSPAVIKSWISNQYKN